MHIVPMDMMQAESPNSRVCSWLFAWGIDEGVTPTGKRIHKKVQKSSAGILGVKLGSF